MRFTAETTRGDWIAPWLGPIGTVGGVVPTGFEAYARIFHPARLTTFAGGGPDACVSTRLSWAAAAELLGARMHPLAQWAAMAGPRQTTPLDHPDEWGTIELGGRMLSAPSEGSLPADLFSRVARVLVEHTADPADATIGIWRGFGELHGPGTLLRLGAVRTPGDRLDLHAAQAEFEREWASLTDPRIREAAEHGPTLSLPAREYVLLAGDLRELTDPDWGFAAGIGWRHEGDHQSPNLVWPADHGWCLGTEIDFDSTLVGGDRQLIDALLVDPGIEALEVPPEASLHFDADRINNGRGQPG